MFRANLLQSNPSLPFKEKIGGLEKIGYMEQELSSLASYLQMEDRDKGLELLHYDPTSFEEWADSQGDPDIYFGMFDGEGWDSDEDKIKIIPLGDLEKFAQGYSTSESDAPPFLYMEFEGIIKNQWLCHFTDHATDIYRNGFKKGIDLYDFNQLALSTHFMRKGSGFNFAFLPKDVDKDSTKYGDEMVVFRASGAKVYHYGDGETQIIFIGATATDIVPIFHNDEDGWYIEGRNNYLFRHEDPAKVVEWVQINYSQYKNLLARKPGKRLLETPR
jgi:hypothetical protein